MDTKKSCRYACTRVPAEGMYVSQGPADDNFRVCRVGEQLVRVWGSLGGRGLPSRVVTALRPAARLMRSDLPFALMPDFHPSASGVIGSVIPSRESVFPDLIGSDAGCGVSAIRLGRIEPPDRQALERLYAVIRRRVAVGSEEYPKLDPTDAALPLWEGIGRLPFVTRSVWDKLERQFGSLGGGNHFIELNVDGADRVWLMVHTGSRFLGGLLASRYGGNVLARESDETVEYLECHRIVLEYARESRSAIVRKVLRCFPEALAEIARIEERLDAVHNFVAIEEHAGEPLVVHRKGACRAVAGELGIIPGSMGSPSFVVAGAGSTQSYASSSHGAGRLLSRGEAFRELRAKDLHRALKHIVWAQSNRLIDEAPQAYKDILTVMRAQSDLVAKRQKLVPILSVKGE